MSPSRYAETINKMVNLIAIMIVLYIIVFGITTNGRTRAYQNSSSSSFLVSNNIQHHVETIAKVNIRMPTWPKL